MLSYKEYQKLHESFSLPLGLSTTQSLGIMGLNGDLVEAKKMKKKMMGEVPVEDEDDDEEEDEEEAETGDGEVVDASSEKDEPEEEDEDEDEDEDSEEAEGEEKPKGGMMFMKKKMKAKTSCGKCKKKMSKCMCKKMTKEEKEWWDSLSLQVDSDLNQKGTDGLNTPKTLDHGWDGISVPKAGEVGFAPETRIGWFG